MRILCCSLLFLLVTTTSSAQHALQSQIEFGIDLSNILIWASGGNRSYQEFELIYRESRQGHDLRFKFNIGNYNYFGEELIFARQIEGSQTEQLEYVNVDYQPKISYLSSIGFTRYLKNNDLPIYYGIDGNIGLARGAAATSLRTIRLNGEQNKLLHLEQNNLLVFGLTPVLGLKKDLTDRILFGIEFGINMNAVRGQLSYQDENGVRVSRTTNRLDLGLNRLINDIVFLIKL